MGGGRLRTAILIAGPTASGKSRLAAAVARRHGGVVVNADALQVYRELSILTARPGPPDTDEVPHRLYGHVPAAVAHSVGQWLDEARAAIGEAWEQGRMPVVAGGTGLYFRILEAGLADIPPIPAAVRRSVRRFVAESGPHAAHAALAARAPEEAARLRPSDPQRIARALEVLEASGVTLGEHQRRAGADAVLAGAEVTRIALLPERAALYASCDARLAAMLEQGALAEVEALTALGLDPGLPAMKAIGVRPLAAHLAGTIGRDEALALAQRETRNYAKRQMTWFRAEKAVKWLNGQDGTARNVDTIIKEMSER